MWFIHGNICTTSDEDCCNTLSFLILSSQHVFLHLAFLCMKLIFINFGCPARANGTSFYMTDSCSLNLGLHSFLQKKDQLHFLFLKLVRVTAKYFFHNILKCNCQQKYQLKTSSSVDLSFKVNIQKE